MVLQRYDALKSSGDAENRPPEFLLNALGYESLRNGKTDGRAIRLFQKTWRSFPSRRTYMTVSAKHTLQPERRTWRSRITRSRSGWIPRIKMGLTG